ncbi:hypothetical protein [Sphingomonas sp. UYP23]
MITALSLALVLATPAPTPAHAKAWTPHSAAALLDASFPSEHACQIALDAAREHERLTPSKPVHDLSYARLFAQARCGSAVRKTGVVWRIRMHWPRRL